jgi:hypothetical protein
MLQELKIYRTFVKFFVYFQGAMKGETLTNIQDKKSKKKGVGVSLATGLTALLKEVSSRISFHLYSLYSRKCDMICF